MGRSRNFIDQTYDHPLKDEFPKVFWDYGRKLFATAVHQFGEPVSFELRVSPRDPHYVGDVYENMYTIRYKYVSPDYIHSVEFKMAAGVTPSGEWTFVSLNWQELKGGYDGNTISLHSTSPEEAVQQFEGMMNILFPLK